MVVIAGKHKNYCMVGWTSAIAICGAIASLENFASAQVVPDNTLGTEGSIVTSQPVDPTVDVISGGATRGDNLFHSFDSFSVLTGRSAYFNNANNIQNIFSRVTGGSISNIDGLLRANGAASLFLLNPNGIIFGTNARLDIGGSFIASTAKSLKFADDTSFSASAEQTTPLLTISVPIGLQFGDSAKSIQVQGNGQGVRTGSDKSNGRVVLDEPTVGLRVQPYKTLALVGGDITLSGGTLHTRGGQIELSSVASPGLVKLDFTDRGWAFSYEDISSFGDIQLLDAAVVDASGDGGGNIKVQGKRVSLRDGSEIEASTIGSRAAGTLNVIASESVEAIGVEANGKYPSGLFAISPRGGPTGDSGKINVETKRLTLLNGARISTDTRSSGLGGNLQVNALESVEVIGTSSVRNPAGDLWRSSLQVLSASDATGNAGNLAIETQRLIIRDGGTVTAGTSGSRPRIGRQASAGQGGSLSVKAKQLVEVSGRDSKLTSGSGGASTAGNLTIETGELTVRDEAEVGVSGGGAGNAGDIIIKARSIHIDNQGKIVAETRSGNGGNITLDVNDLLLLRRNSQISSTAGTAEAGGDGGNINIDTTFLVALENSEIAANAFAGRGGNIEINVRGLFISPDSRIAATSDRGIDGVVTIDDIDVDPSQGLVVLPVELVDASNQIVAGCATGSENQFVVNGRGGLPPNPRERLNAETVLTDWAMLEPEAESRSNTIPDRVVNSAPTQIVPTQIVEATQWAFNEKNEVILMAASTNKMRSPALNCNGTYPAAEILLK
ncbi:filamentous hemagglutinin N-terminal domain-containing protein [Chroococcidiopsis sp. CCNUC1]|uniref:two-partner secretion domain-containing protein n=1 Tax=Chroococcidiopsis sp. CCNUC1 TaxID=2653189 RepID=UPI0020205C0A|nr:filamentous hemagglutinin N-terminal domain-containing protein [Chroococcidiopsis sp. CCNUC1]URD51218.1 filamentous hemagglutinin N-terminal domain-containing protein [Chroococcidiopsis sp. CCNUC1]